DEEGEQRESADGKMPPVEREAPRTCRGARHDDDVQLGPSLFTPPDCPSGQPFRRMTRSPQMLERILATDPLTAAWMARQRRQAALPLHIRRHLPRALAGRVRVADGEGPELMLTANVGAIAGIARQRAPELLSALRREGYEFTSIRIRVQVDNGMNPVSKTEV